MAGRTFIVSCVCAVALVACGDGGDRLRVVTARDTLAVGVRGDGTPFTTSPDAAVPSGFEVGIATDVSACLDVRPRFVTLSAADRITMLEDDEVDVVAASFAVTDSRAQEVAFTRPYFHDGVALVVANADAAVTPDDLTGRSIATAASSTAEDAVAARVPDVRLVLAEGYGAAFDAFEDGRADAVAANVTVLVSLLASRPGEYRQLAELLTIEPIALAVEHGQNALLERVDGCVEGLRTRAWNDAYNASLSPLTRLRAPDDVQMPG